LHDKLEASVRSSGNSLGSGSEIPAHGVGGWFQLQPTDESLYWNFRIPTTEVGGFFKSRLSPHTPSMVTNEG